MGIFNRLYMKYDILYIFHTHTHAHIYIHTLT